MVAGCSVRVDRVYLPERTASSAVLCRDRLHRAENGAGEALVVRKSGIATPSALADGDAGETVGRKGEAMAWANQNSMKRLTRAP